MKYKLIAGTNTFVMKDILPNIIGYLFNRDLIDLPEEYWIEEDNGWKSYYRKNYKKILKDFDKLVKDNYRIEKIGEE